MLAHTCTVYVYRLRRSRRGTYVSGVHQGWSDQTVLPLPLPTARKMLLDDH